MVIKKINIKKSESTLASITFGVLVAIIIFVAFFNFISLSADESGRTIDTKYNTSYTGLNNQIDSLSSTKDDLQSAAQNLTEPGPAYGVAWNGIKGLLSLFQLFIGMINVVDQSFQFLTSPLEGIVPDWILTIVAIGLILFVLYVLISIFKGDSNVIR